MKSKKQTSASKLKLTSKENHIVGNVFREINKMDSEVERRQHINAVLEKEVSKERRVMVLMGITIKVIKAKLGMPRAQWDYLATSVAMQKAIAGNSGGFFLPVFSMLGLWLTENTALNTALNVLKNKGLGGKGMKTTAMTNLKVTLNFALDYINGVSALNQPNAITIIEEALMIVINPGPRVVKQITVKADNTAGVITVSCPAAYIDGKRVTATYEKSYSADGGTTWTAMPPIAKCKAKATGLRSGIPYIFRSRVTTAKGGTSIWVVSGSVTPL